MKLRYFFFFSFIFLFTTFSIAQENCSAMVNNAISVASQACNGLGLNQVCYGNVTLEVVPAPGISNLVFNTQGDRANVADIQSLRLSSQLDSTGEWGIALMKLQTLATNTVPGQGVTVAMFGQVALNRDTVPGYGAMQAFTVVPGAVQSLCYGAPPNGILIQTPRGAGRVQMRVNGVDISLGSSAFIQSDAATSTLSVALLDGSAELTAGGVTQALTPGTLSNIPVSADGTTAGAPSEPIAFDPAWFAGIPVSLLPEAVSVSGAANAAGGSENGQITLISGEYQFVSDSCGTSLPSHSYQVMFSETTISFGNSGNRVYNFVEANTYAWSYDSGVGFRFIVIETIFVQSPTSFILHHPTWNEFTILGYCEKTYTLVE